MFKVYHSAVHLHKFASVIIIFPQKNPRNNYKAHIFNIHCKAKYDRNLLQFDSLIVFDVSESYLTY